MNFYQSKWTEVDSLERKGLPKSALEVVNEILAKAKSDKNTEQVIKSFIFRLKYKNSNEEKAFEKLCYELDSAIKEAAFPDKAIMHSMLADMYWWYYQNNRYKFQNRSNTVNFDNTDMETWTLDHLVNVMIINYNQSLANKEELQKISTEKYKELIYSGTKPKILRPSLYDFLAHKAVDFFSNTEIALTKPADNFELREDFYFSDANKFISEDITTSDTLSLHFMLSQIFLDLLKFRLKRKNEVEALIDADLKRLKFAYAHSVHNNKESLYLDALTKLENEYNSNPFSGEVSLAIAQYYYNLSGNYDPLSKTTDKYKNFRVKAHEICNRVIEKFPNTNATEHCKQLIITIETHNLSFNTESIVMPDAKFSAK
ncbi:MAG: hypothetical protein HC831_11630 [Chloroflexia bacterium]|nr:hypothetical protein [Chloroflexia bacterium]